MKRMEIVKILSILMAIATVIYVGAEVYGYSNSSQIRDVVYFADLYEGESSPPIYTPEQLGIVQVGLDYENNTKGVHIIVDKDREPFPLQTVQPIFQYNGTLYKISPLWTAYGVPPNLPQQPAGAAFAE
jgi:hypothetical protein